MVYNEKSSTEYYLQVQKCWSEGSEFLIIGKQVKDLYCLATVIGCVCCLSTVLYGWEGSVPQEAISQETCL